GPRSERRGSPRLSPSWPRSASSAIPGSSTGCSPTSPSGWPRPARSASPLGSVCAPRRPCPRRRPRPWRRPRSPRFLSPPSYPALRSPARLALEVGESGLGFFASPASHVAHLGTWYRPLLGGLSFPYTPAFHLPFALSGAVYDEVVTSMKLAGAALAAVAIA